MISCFQCFGLNLRQAFVTKTCKPGKQRHSPRDRLSLFVTSLSILVILERAKKVSVRTMLVIRDYPASIYFEEY